VYVATPSIAGEAMDLIDAGRCTRLTSCSDNRYARALAGRGPCRILTRTGAIIEAAVL
jgi:hypothetical protein